MRDPAGHVGRDPDRPALSLAGRPGNELRRGATRRVCADVRAPTLNLVAAESAAAREATTAIVARPPAEILAEFDPLPLLRMPARHQLLAVGDVDPRRLHQTLLKAYERPPSDFESLLGVPGLGPKSLRPLPWSPS